MQDNNYLENIGGLVLGGPTELKSQILEKAPSVSWTKQQLDYKLR